MLQALSLQAFLTLAKTAARVAVYREITADLLTPIGIVETLKEEMQDGAILESGTRQQEEGRYSFISFGSIAQLIVKNKLVIKRIGSTVTNSQTHPFNQLRQLIADLSCASAHQAVDFINGAIGYISYDAVRFFETIPDRHAANHHLPDMFFNFYRTTLMFDHQQQKLLISMIVEVGDHPEQTYQAAQDAINDLVNKISNASSDIQKPLKQAHPSTAVEEDINDEEFINLVERAKEYIVSGDAFQIVLSRCFTQQYTVHPFDIYRALRRVSPAPYMFYFPLDEGVLIGASPEKLISVRNRQLEMNPIAGTRQRTEQSNDNEIESDLLQDQKERAEHMMLVDLARNDVGAVCEPGTVKVTEMLKVKHYSHVSHITSVVQGTLRNDRDALDALAYAFPAGTLSGAPKIRAMQIIDELETSKRGIYGGAICRLDYQGNLDSCIAIRIALLKDGIATVRTGAGIVYDSNPRAEANETRHKAYGMLAAITFAHERT